MPDKIHFFDLYSNLPGPRKSWSYNTLKVRSVLNFKGIPYTQSWVSYPDIKPLLSGLGVPPHSETSGGAPYTLPAIVDPTLADAKTQATGALMDSLPIVMRLDAQFPDAPPLFPSGQTSFAIYTAVARLCGLLAPSYRPFVVPRVASRLDARGEAFFRKTREAAYGKPLEDILPTAPAELAALWRVAETETEPLLTMLRGYAGESSSSIPPKKGPFFEGDKPGYADLFLASTLAFVERFDRPLFDRFMGLGQGEFQALYTACQPWLEGQGEEKEWPVQRQ